MILLDAGGVIAAIDHAEPKHESCRLVLEHESGPLLLSPFVLAKIDYMLGKGLSLDAELEFLHEVARGAYELVAFDSGDVGRAIRVIERYADLDIGLADASIVVLADRYAITRVLTLDERHFRALRTSDRRPFVLLPADAS